MRTMRDDIRKQLAEMKEKIYELQRDLGMYLDNEQDELNAIPEDSEEHERADEIVTALKDAVDNLEDAMDNIQIAID
jgi:chromosome segregation ATPase